MFGGDGTPNYAKKSQNCDLLSGLCIKHGNFLTKCKFYEKREVFGTSTVSVGNSNAKRKFFLEKWSLRTLYVKHGKVHTKHGIGRDLFGFYTNGMFVIDNRFNCV